MSHTIAIMIDRFSKPNTEYACYEPQGAWCRHNAVGPGEEPPENPLNCWFTVLASGLVPSGKPGTYIGPPCQMAEKLSEKR